jgi:tetratricopeptide (TPR) repeat protein
MLNATISPADGAARISAALLVLWLTGCAALQSDALRETRPAGLSSGAVLDVPFIAQETHQCGPASLAMALQASGANVAAADLTERIYLPGREGSLQVEMLAATREHARLAYPIAPRMEDLLREVVGGNPVVVLQNLGLGIAPKWHYAVVIGYDLDREEILLHSGTTPKLAMPLRQFERTWARSGHWAFVVMEPSRLPVTAEEDGYVRAAAALERQHPAEAQRAYATALATWPANLAARVGMGNTAHALGDKQGAENAYRLATQQHPQSADAWNNLANVLGETGRHREARAAALTAINLGGPRVERYWQTLSSLPAPE